MSARSRKMTRAVVGQSNWSAAGTEAAALHIQVAGPPNPETGDRARYA